jgi:hypothetical protein
MPQAPLQHVATLGIDIGKNSLHLIGMEACVGAHHLSRQLLALGHDVKLIPASGREPVLPSYRGTAISFHERDWFGATRSCDYPMWTAPLRHRCAKVEVLSTA